MQLIYDDIQFFGYILGFQVFLLIMFTWEIFYSSDSMCMRLHGNFFIMKLFTLPANKKETTYKLNYETKDVWRGSYCTELHIRTITAYYSSN